MVDISKIRVGDEVTVRARVLERGSVSGNLRIANLVDLGSCWFSPADVVSHTPPPREIEIGDVITWGGGDRKYKVLAISGQRAWLRCISFGEQDERLMSVSTLRHAT